MNQAYLREVFPGTHVISGQQFMPFKADFREESGKVINAIGVLTFPLLMSFSLPVFLYTIVLEKE